MWTDGQPRFPVPSGYAHRVKNARKNVPGTKSKSKEKNHAENWETFCFGDKASLGQRVPRLHPLAFFVRVVCK